MLQCPSIQSDMNGDGVQTISDIWAVLVLVYHWPGNFVVEMVARFFELTEQSCGGWLSFGISTVVWLACYLAIVVLYVTISEQFD